MDGFTGEIRIISFSFAPQNWAMCDGQSILAAQNPTLFKIIGTKYGSDGPGNFLLPNLNGSFPIGKGFGPGLTSRNVGDRGGVEKVTLTADHLPPHQHTLLSAAPGNSALAMPVSSSLLGSAPTRPYTDQNTSLVQMNPQTLSVTGGGQAHDNMPPYVSMFFCICLNGEYPVTQ